MKLVGELNLGFSDAQNYTLRKNKQMLSEVFVKNIYLDDILNSNSYYLIGEKGTGKTAYAAFLSNSEYNGTRSFLKSMGRCSIICINCASMFSYPNDCWLCIWWSNGIFWWNR